VSYVSHDVNILDLEPTADFSSSPEPSLEGSDVAFTDLSTSSPDTIVSWNWNFGDGETASDANPVHTYADDGIYTVTLTVTDEDGSTDTISHIVTILNVAPAVQAGADQTADEGSIISFDGSFTDPGADTHTVIWDFGDGEMAEGTLTPTHTYVDEGTYTVKLTVTDDDGGEGSATLIVVVNNVPPITEAGSDMTANEGDTISFSGEFTDPGSLDTQTVQWDFGDGTSPVDGTLSPTHVFAEDGEYTVTLTVTDNDGGVGTDTLIVTVYNVAPAVDAGVDQTVDEGSPVTFAGSFTDPGTLDTHSVTWNFGDGTEPAVDTLAPTHTYADNGVYTVTLTVVDDDGAEGTDTLTVTVNNVAPTVEAGPDQTATEGSSVTFNGEFTDPGWLDTHAITWDFGDGTPQVSGVLDPSHVYGDDGVYTVTLNVSDNNGGTQTDSLTVTVGNVAPQVNAGSDIVGEERDTIVFSGTFTDPGLDTYTIAWNFGDGTSATGTLTPMHAYERCGSYTVTLTVTDDDGGVGSDTLTVNVKGPRTIKGDALSLLVSVRTGDKKVDWAIECAMKLVRCSLNSQFWADGDHLAVTRHGYCGWQPTGKMVFIYEGLAIGEMQCSMEFWIKKGPTPQQQQAIDLFKTVISKLVKADQLLVRTAIDEAKRMTPPTNNCRLNAYKMAVSNAEKAYGRALCYLSSNKPELALVNFMQAWEHAQLAMELAC
jgi:PKD repeat protein